MATINNLDEALELEEREVREEAVVVSENEDFGKPYEISVMNANSGAKVPLLVLPANTLEQVYRKTAEDLGIDQKENIIFVNEKTQVSIADQDTLISEFGLQAGDVLTIAPDGKVAAVS